ncbi:uncharacterized protein BKA78DRAFT_382617 [Phyllosticta capitalensis]|uniref:uncharacterized protein n=1 Tax=Phyllosticta capitalensis TaxID=121624 RepID=UPI0031319E8F
MPYQAHHKGSRGSPNSNSQWETVVTALPHITSSRHQVFKKPRSPPTSSIKLQRSAHEAALVHSTLTFRPPANALYASDHQRRRQKLRFSLVIPVSKFYQIYSSKFTMSQVINPGYYSANQAQYHVPENTQGPENFEGLPENQPPQPSLTIEMDCEGYSRAETQIKVKLTLADGPLGIGSLHMPRERLSNCRSLAKKAESATHTLQALLVSSAAMEREDLRRETLRRAQYGLEPKSEVSEGGEARICATCMKRENKRAGRKSDKGRTEKDPIWESYAKHRALMINSNEYRNWDICPGRNAREMKFHVRIACYCRHHKVEKPGYRILFTLKTDQGLMVAQAVSAPVFITDNHKDTKANKRSREADENLGEGLPHCKRRKSKTVPGPAMCGPVAPPVQPVAQPIQQPIPQLVQQPVAQPVQYIGGMAPGAYAGQNMPPYNGNQTVQCWNQTVQPWNPFFNQNYAMSNVTGQDDGTLTGQFSQLNLNQHQSMGNFQGLDNGTHEVQVHNGFPHSNLNSSMWNVPEQEVHDQNGQNWHQDLGMHNWTEQDGGNQTPHDTYAAMSAQAETHGQYPPYGQPPMDVQTPMHTGSQPYVYDTDGYLIGAQNTEAGNTLDPNIGQAQEHLPANGQLEWQEQPQPETGLTEMMEELAEENARREALEAANGHLELQEQPQPETGLSEMMERLSERNLRREPFEEISRSLPAFTCNEHEATYNMLHCF